MIADHLLAHIGQYALLRNATGEVLLRYTKESGTWSLPGGRLEEGEDWLESLKREVEEEVGLEIEEVAPFAIHLMKEGSVIKYCVYFTAMTHTPRLVTVDQTTHRAVWTAKDQVGELPFESDQIRDVVLKFLS